MSTPTDSDQSKPMPEATQRADDSADSAAAGFAAAPAGASSIARRRALLKGLSKGAALAGAAVPLSSLATSGQRMRLVTNSTNYICTISGQMSVMVSGMTATPVDCVGMKVTDYQNGKNWPTTKTMNGKTYPACLFGTVPRATEETFFDCFGQGSTSKIGDLINLKVPTDESYWVCAVLNANVKSTTYPYSSAEVCGQRVQVNSAAQSAALGFHKILCAAA